MPSQMHKAESSGPSAEPPTLCATPESRLSSHCTYLFNPFLDPGLQEGWGRISFSVTPAPGALERITVEEHHLKTPPLRGCREDPRQAGHWS